MATKMTSSRVERRTQMPLKTATVTSRQVTRKQAAIERALSKGTEMKNYDAKMAESQNDIRTQQRPALEKPSLPVESLPKPPNAPFTTPEGVMIGQEKKNPLLIPVVEICQMIDPPNLGGELAHTSHFSPTLREKQFKEDPIHIPGREMVQFEELQPQPQDQSLLFKQIPECDSVQILQELDFQHQSFEPALESQSPYFDQTFQFRHQDLDLGQQHEGPSFSQIGQAPQQMYYGLGLGQHMFLPQPHGLTCGSNGIIDNQDSPNQGELAFDEDSQIDPRLLEQAAPVQITPNLGHANHVNHHPQALAPPRHGFVTQFHGGPLDFSQPTHGFQYPFVPQYMPNILPQAPQAPPGYMTVLNTFVIPPNIQQNGHMHMLYTAGPGFPQQFNPPQNMPEPTRQHDQNQQHIITANQVQKASLPAGKGNAGSSARSQAELSTASRSNADAERGMVPEADPTIHIMTPAVVKEGLKKISREFKRTKDADKLCESLSTFEPLFSC
ncbi:hypothetical protein WAI453_012363 [Rhynchosporium graminicola]|uniref:Uncharacterized protein n=1 Tax=Rhynchosporium graminicola TaxID=2792576 RepID=A0A1E1KYP4_9HELO|nr:uncharacterized protein RCO7_06175 [Rhynchosporium commune]